MEKKKQNKNIDFLSRLKTAIIQGDVDKLKILNGSAVMNQGLLKSSLADEKNPFKYTNAIIIACREKQLEILKYLLGGKSKIIEKTTDSILPTDEDEFHYNAFYYAIRSGNSEFIQLLINKWPGNYFNRRNEKQLEEIISSAYEELILKNVKLSDDVKLFVEKQLINLRFHAANSKCNDVDNYIQTIKERVIIVIENFQLLKEKFSMEEQIDEEFLHILICISKHINVLKQKLKSTYDRLPWEEIEFCLIIFISCHTRQQELNFFYYIFIDAQKILNYLGFFLQNLESVLKNINFKNISNLKTSIKEKRSTIIQKILGCCPEFRSLYEDYHHIRDLCSLEKMSETLKLVLFCDVKEKEGKIVISRVLQIIGEYMKNTLESPKLSETTRDILFVSLPKSCRKIIQSLRDSISHIESLLKRTEIEENKEDKFFAGLLYELKGVGTVIDDILQAKKDTIFGSHMEKLRSVKSFDEYNKVIAIFKKAHFNFFDENFKNLVKYRIKELVDELNRTVLDQTDYEKGLFEQIYAECRSIDTFLSNGDEIFQFLAKTLHSDECNVNEVNFRDFNKLFEYKESNLNENQSVASVDFERIGELLKNVYESVFGRSVKPYVNDAIRLITHIIGMTASLDVKWIQDLEYKLKDEEKSKTFLKHANTFTREIYTTELTRRIKELESALKKHGMSIDSLPKSFEVYKNDKQIKSVTEILVLDIMTLAAALKMNLGMDLFFIDSRCPILVGKCLRNHLAHNNDIVTILSDDLDRMIFLNAIKLIEKDFDENKKNNATLFKENISNLKMRQENCLNILKKKYFMFDACERDNMDDLKSIIQNGADIRSRNIDGFGALHFVMKSGSVNMLQFLLDFDKELSLSTHELETAVSNGKTKIVEYFVKETPKVIDDLKGGKSKLLKLAARNGHKDIVEILIKNNCDPNIFDFHNLPIHYAAEHNHLNVVEFLLTNGGHSINVRNKGGFSLLHIAADFGYLEMVEYLLKHGAEVNANTYFDKGTPLHLAVVHNHFEVIKVLVAKGANVNARSLNGISSINTATRRNNVQIVRFLLEHGADVNNTGIMCKYSSLHFACEDGYKDVVEVLLKNGADVCLYNTDGYTPSHLAAKGGHCDILTILFEYGSDISVKAKNQDTLLHCAAKSGKKEIVDYLISRLDINAKNANGSTPLHFAVYFDNPYMVDMLLSNNALVDLQDIDGNTPLHLSVGKKQSGYTKKLLQKTSKIDIENKFGATPLCLAIMHNQKEAVVLLIEHGAAITGKAKMIPLHAAITKGYHDIVKLMIKMCHAEEYFLWSQAISLAVYFEQVEIVELLTVNNSIVHQSIVDNGEDLLEQAIRKNNKRIVIILIENGALKKCQSVDKLLFKSVKIGHADMVNILVKYCNSVDNCIQDGKPLLIQSVLSGFIRIFRMLIDKGCNVNVASSDGTTVLHVAALLGHKEMVEILLEKGANVNAVNVDGTPLHLAAAKNDKAEIVEILLKSGANMYIEDDKKRTAIQMAVANNNYDVVKAILSGSNTNLLKHTGSVDGISMLHIAVQRENLDMIKFLIEQGIDANVQNNYGSKPIHHAAREGLTDIVKFFLGKGCQVNDRNNDNYTLLHFAIMKGHTETVKFLLSENANVNAQTKDGHTPLHFCVLYSFKEIAKILLNNGAIYNACDNGNKKPIDMIKKRNTYFSQNMLKNIEQENTTYTDKEQNDILVLLRSTDNLFKAVKCNDISEVTKCIENGAILNAKDAKDNMLLHYAAWKGYTHITEILLKFKANVNASIKDGSTPLHYSAKFSHLGVVKILLSHGAIYNLKNISKSTPLDLATDKSINYILKTIDDLFNYAVNGNRQILKKIKEINDSDIFRAVLNARNEDSKTVLTCAKTNNFSKIDDLKEIIIGDMFCHLCEAQILTNQGRYKEAQELYHIVLKSVEEKLGVNNFVYLEVKQQMGVNFYKEHKYNQALETLTEVYNLERDVFGQDYVDTLNTGSKVALVLHRLGRNNEALDMYNNIYEKQKKLSKPGDENLSDTQLHMALVLDKLQRHEEALKLNTENYETCKKEKGEKNVLTLCAKNNIAMVLGNMKKYDEAIQMYEEVYKLRKQILGSHHELTLRTQHNIAGMYMAKGRYEDAIILFEQVFEQQKNVFGMRHPETLRTQFNIAILHNKKDNAIASIQALKEYLINAKPILGDRHPDILSAYTMIELNNVALKVRDSDGIIPYLANLQDNLKNAASNGEEKVVIELIKNGVDVNYFDEDGRSALYYAAYNGNLKVVKILLENSGNIFQVTNKGNTLFHACAFKKHENIFEVLLQHAAHKDHSRFASLINAKTLSGGSTALHVAAKTGSYAMVKSLLMHGAIFDVKNSECLMPSEVSQNRDVINLLTFIQDIFIDALNGDTESVVMKVKAGSPDQVKAAVRTRNFQNKTLLQVVLIFCERSAAVCLVNMLRDDAKQND